MNSFAYRTSRCFLPFAAAWICLLLLASTSESLPSSKFDRYNEQLSARLALYSHIASIACDNDDYRITDWDNSYARYLGPCTDVRVFRNDGDLAYVAYDDSLHAVVVTWRGSANADNWLTNFNLVQTGYRHAKSNKVIRDDKGDEVKVHLGFLKSVRDIHDPIRSYVSTLLKNKPSGTGVIVTGHSLGGAQATLCALDLVEHKFPLLDAYLFASPRVGNTAFARYFDSSMRDIGVSAKRVTLALDQVPHLPFRMWGYAHVGGEVYVDGEETVVVQDDGWGVESFLGNIRNPWFLCNWIVHVQYNTKLPGVPDPREVAAPKRDEQCFYI
eukprot:Nk52_evm3s365 gene=Nk52_evmTU3s365